MPTTKTHNTNTMRKEINIMKKIFSVVLAIVMIFSMSAIAFAADAETPAAEEKVDSAFNLGAVDLSAVQDVINSIISQLSLQGVLDACQSIINKIVSLIEGFAAQSSVLGAVADLEAKIGDLGIVGDILQHIENLINTLKTKIKNFYAGLRETAVEATEAQTSADTGSSSTAAVAAFAAISVAAATAFVCTKKKEN